MPPTRRRFLQASFTQLTLLRLGGGVLGCASTAPRPNPQEESGYRPPTISPPQKSNFAQLGALQDPDKNGLMLPPGFSSRIVAQSSKVVGSSDYIWHPAPDGGVTFLANDGGYVYVSNSETLFTGGAGALQFSKDGTLLDAYSILQKTSGNCAGGPTPWGTWLSCEEISSGRVWECDPFGEREAIVRPALGVFKHEAVAVDPISQFLYLTEDEEDGRLYRFRPAALRNNSSNLKAGTLEVLQLLEGEEGAIQWLPLPDPSGASQATRRQVPASTAFDGGEGVWWHEGVVYFSTKGDNRIRAVDIDSNQLAIVYDRETSENPVLGGVDNLWGTAAGDILVAEDGDDMQIVALLAETHQPKVIVQIAGHPGSEITGPALCPYRERLYFSSQRGPSGNNSAEGITYEVRGPFFVD